MLLLKVARLTLLYLQLAYVLEIIELGLLNPTNMLFPSCFINSRHS